MAMLPECVCSRCGSRWGRCVTYFGDPRGTFAEAAGFSAQAKLAEIESALLKHCDNIRVDLKEGDWDAKVAENKLRALGLWREEKDD